MSFLSFEFALFLGVALLLYYLAPARGRPALLLSFSGLFYLSWSVLHTVLLAAVTLGVYAMGLWIERRRTEQGKKAAMALGVMTLLLLLFAFKSAGWAAHEFFSRPEGWSAGTALLIPLGLSYYVFRMVGYLLDVYWETIPAQRSLVSLALYGVFFPQIVSGPIQRAESFFAQLGDLENPDAARFQTGLRRILFGLVKKIALADQLAVLVGHVHANPAGFSSLELLVGAYAFSVQLYLDFSGLTDIALGIGLLFGLRGPENFALPYFAPNLQAFWRRWHMSLTTWLTDYLFTPLRMSFRRLGTAGLALAILVNMVAIGLWHGFTWTYLAFGLASGLFMIVSVLTLRSRNAFFSRHPGLARARAWAAPLLTFHLVVFTQILFRAESLSSAGRYLGGLLGSSLPRLRFDEGALGLSVPVLALCGAGYGVAEVVAWGMSQPRRVEQFLALPAFWRQAIYAALIFLTLFLFEGHGTFIYARF